LDRARFDLCKIYRLLRRDEVVSRVSPAIVWAKL